MKNKAAMFGLDARIALAIFGALSIISGAALFSAIENSKTVSVMSDLNEVSKAFEQYFLDTGKTIGRFDTSDKTSFYYNLFKIEDLVNNSGVKGWNGPYLKYKAIRSTDLNYSSRKDHSFYAFSGDIDGSAATGWTDFDCIKGKRCVLYLGFKGNTLETVPSQKALFASLDKKLDKGDGMTLGKVRAYDGTNFYDIYYKTDVVLSNPLD